MPELPDIELYLAKLRERILGKPLISLKVYTPFVLRSVSPSPRDLEGEKVLELRRLGKRIVLGFSNNLFLIVHLMIAGRLRWTEGPGEAKRLGGKLGQAALEFDNGTLFLTEAGSKKRASIMIVRGEEALREHDPGGIEPLISSFEEFAAVLRSENHTLKRSLTNPHLFSGIGNVYSDEILHAAQLSPLRLTKSLKEEEVRQLFEAAQAVLTRWIARLKKQFEGKFPGAGDVTAFRPDFAVHGKFGKPCPVCGKPVQRICYADNEANYCAQCQNGGRLLADRSLSRLLKDAWPEQI